MRGRFFSMKAACFGIGGVEIAEGLGEVVVEFDDVVAEVLEGEEEVVSPDVGADGLEPGVGRGIGGVEDSEFSHGGIKHEGHEVTKDHEEIFLRGEIGRNSECSFF